MLDAAGVDAGSHVLDVAAGAGGQSLAAARRTGGEGRVVATDISPAILAFAAQAAAQAGVSIETRELDGEAVDAVWTDSFDAVISRLGLIYFPDQQRALSGMRKGLRKGGRMAAIVYSTAERNEFFSVPVRIIRTRAKLPPPLPGQPGPFSLGSPGVLQAALVQAGFHDVSVQTVAGAAAPAIRCRVRALRARVLRRLAPDAVVGARRRNSVGVARDRGSTQPLRDGRGLRRPLRTAGRGSVAMSAVGTTLACIVLSMGCACATLARADAVTDWNIKSGEVIVEAKLATQPAVRVMAIVQVAAHQAVVAALHRGASVEAALAAAHRVTLKRLLPAQEPMIEAAYQAALGAVADNAFEERRHRRRGGRGPSRAGGAR